MLSAIALGATAFGASILPITPQVDHSKKATCGIKWTISKTEPIKGFWVYRGISTDFYEADQIADVDNTTNHLTDWGAEQYRIYNYWVVPYDYNDSADYFYDLPDPSRYRCENKRFWSSGEVYLTASVKEVAIGTKLPIYFKINIGTDKEPQYDHVKPDKIVFTKITDLRGNDDKDVAVICNNRDDVYTGELEGAPTFLKANGAFGYVQPLKPGVMYIRAYYKSATTINPLRVEVKKPTFDLRVPEGDIDIVDNNYRNLYLKCNGKFVCPDVERTLGDSVSIWPCSLLDATDSFENGLYDNSFGFFNMIKSNESTMFDITYNGMLVKECRITPVWDMSRRLTVFYMNQFGQECNTFQIGKEYKFGIKYGDTPISQKISKCGYSWLTIYEEESLSQFFWCWDFLIGYTNGGEFNSISYYNLTYTPSNNELASFNGKDTGWVKIRPTVLDRTFEDEIYINNK